MWIHYEKNQVMKRDTQSVFSTQFLKSHGRYLINYAMKAVFHYAGSISRRFSHLSHRWTFSV